MYIAQAETEMDNLPVQKALLLAHNDEEIYPDFAKEYATSELVDIRGSAPLPCVLVTLIAWKAKLDRA